MPDKDINIKVEAQGADQAKQRLDDISRSGKKMGEEVAGAQRDISRETGKANEKTEEAKRKIGGLSKVVDGLKSAVTGMVTAWLSIEGVVKLLQSIEERLQRIKTAQKELAESSRDLDQTTKSIASQANIIGQPGWEASARQQAMALQERTGLPIGMAGSVWVSTHSAFGTSGQLLTPGQQAIAGVVGEYARMKDLSSGEANSLTKLLSAMGVQSAPEAQHRIQQLGTVQQASKAKTFGEFIAGATKAMIPQMAQGASVEYALSGYASALDVQPTAELAASQVESLGAMLQNEKVVAALAQSVGITPEQFRELPYDQRRQLFAAWVAQESATGAGQARMIESGVTADQLSRAMTLYSPGQIDRQKMFYGLAGSATADQYARQVQAYGQSIQAELEEFDAKKERLELSANDYERIGLRMLELSDAQWRLMQARGQEWGRLTHRGDYEQVLRTQWEPLVERAVALEDPEARRRIYHWLRKQKPGVPGHDFTLEELGRAHVMLSEAEGNPIPVVQGGIHYHQENISIQQPRTDPIEYRRSDPNDLSY